MADEKTFGGIPGQAIDPRALGGAMLHRTYGERMEERAAYQTAANIPDNGLVDKSAGRTQHALQELVAMTDGLDKMIQVLTGKLEPIMSAAPPEVGAERGRGVTGSSPAVSGVTSALLQVTAHLFELRSRVEYLIQRIEL